MPDQLPFDSALEAVRLSRRQFLWGLSTLAGGSLLAACQVREDKLDVRSDYDQTLASPQPLPPIEGEGTPPVAQGDSLALEKFLALSAVLTGFNELSPGLGQTYLESLQANSQMAMTPTELYEQAGFTGDSQPSLEALNQAGIFAEEASRTLANKIIEYWYTGVYDQPGGGQQTVATTVDALAWQALTYTKPLTLCGPKPDFWAERPEAAPMPPVSQVSLQELEASGDN